MKSFDIDCTGDCVVGDEIEFTEAVFSGSYRNPKYQGERIIQAKIVNDSYGEQKQQHTFTLQIINVSGCEAEEVLSVAEKNGTIRRKARNIYRNGTTRRRWKNQDDRIAAQHEKHERGDKARALRRLLKEQAI